MHCIHELREHSVELIVDGAPGEVYEVEYRSDSYFRPQKLIVCDFEGPRCDRVEDSAETFIMALTIAGKNQLPIAGVEGIACLHLWPNNLGSGTKFRDVNVGDLIKVAVRFTRAGRWRGIFWGVLLSDKIYDRHFCFRS